MARGRKKGGLQINKLNDREEITNMIVNQINSLNKKIKGFKADGNEEHMQFVKTIMSNDMAQFTQADTLSKSKKFYADKNTVWLKKTLAALVKINNHDIYGTQLKYNKVMSSQLKAVKAYAENYLRKKGYNENFIFEVTNSKDFFIQLFDAFREDTVYGSDQTLEKVALNYSNSGISDKEKDKILSNIEYSKNTLNRLREQQKAVDEVLHMRNGKMR